MRLHQVDQHQLLAFPIVDKSELNEQMNGTAVARQVAADGSKAFTLYINPARNTAFLHVLPLTGDYPGARCLDLPTAGAPSLLHFYILAPQTAADGSATLYAANGALCTAVSVNVSADDEMHVDAVAYFTPASTSSCACSQYTLALQQSSPFSRQTDAVLRWPAGDLVCAHRPTGPHRAHLDDTVTSPALRSDAVRLYVLEPARGLLTPDMLTGLAGPLLPTPGQIARGILWIE